MATPRPFPSLDAAKLRENALTSIRLGVEDFNAVGSTVMQEAIQPALCQPFETFSQGFCCYSNTKSLHV